MVFERELIPERGSKLAKLFNNGVTTSVPFSPHAKPVSPSAKSNYGFATTSTFPNASLIKL